MNEYKDIYYKLFNKITDIITELQEVQQEVEDIYISRQETSKIETIPIIIKK